MQTFRVTRCCPPPPSRVAVTAELLSDQFLIRQWKTSPWRGWVLAWLLGSIIHSWSGCWWKLSQYSEMVSVLLLLETASTIKNLSLHQLNFREVSLAALIAWRCCRLGPRGRGCCRARAATSPWTRCGAAPWRAAPSPCWTPSHTPAAIGEIEGMR